MTRIAGAIVLAAALTGCETVPYQNDCGVMVETAGDVTMRQSPSGKRIIVIHDGQRWVLDRDAIDSLEKAHGLRDGSLYYAYDEDHEEYRLEGSVADILTADTEQYMSLFKEADVSPRNRRVSYQEALELFFAEGDKSVESFRARASTAKASPDRSGDSIVVWRVGSPWGDGSAPSKYLAPRITAELEKLGNKVECRSFPAKGFAEVFFDAMDRHEEPDILVFDNYMILEGGYADVGDITGITSRPGVADTLVSVSESLCDLNWDSGWEFLVTSSRNHIAAKAFAMRQPATELSIYGSIKDSPSPAVSEVTELATAASFAYVSGNSRDLSDLSDPDRIGDGIFGATDTQVPSVGITVITGNDKLAFVQSKCTFEQTHWLGTITVLTTMRKVEGRWKVLSISSDPVSLEQLQSARSLSRKLTNNGGSSTLTPGQILTVEDVFPEPASGERFGSFEWRASRSANLICEVVEFDYQSGTRLFVLSPKPGATSTLSTGLLWSEPVRWTWRVWSIDEFGNVVFSRANHFWESSCR